MSIGFDNEEVLGDLDKSNFSGVVGMKIRSELTKERMSDEKVEGDSHSSWALL